MQLDYQQEKRNQKENVIENFACFVCSVIIDIVTLLNYVYIFVYAVRVHEQTKISIKQEKENNVTM